MGFLDFFKRSGASKKKAKVVENPSPEQTAFADNVLLTISPVVEKYGFKKITEKVKTYSTTITFRNRDQYIKVTCSSYPTDYPYCYNIELGEGDSEFFF